MLVSRECQRESVTGTPITVDLPFIVVMKRTRAGKKKHHSFFHPIQHT